MEAVSFHELQEHSKTAMILVYGVSMIKDLKHERHWHPEHDRVELLKLEA